MKKYIGEGKYLPKRNIRINVYISKLSLTFFYLKIPFKFQQRQSLLIISFAARKILSTTTYIITWITICCHFKSSIKKLFKDINRDDESQNINVTSNVIYK